MTTFLCTPSRFLLRSSLPPFLSPSSSPPSSYLLFLYNLIHRPHNMRCYDGSHGLEVKVLHGKKPYDEYHPHFNDEDNSLCSWIPVKAGDELTIQATITGTLRVGHIDVFVDGTLRCSKALFVNTVRRASRTEKISVAYCKDPTKINPHKLVVKDLSNWDRPIQRVPMPAVGTIELRLALAEDDFQMKTHTLTHADLQNTNALGDQNASAVHVDIAPTHEIDFVKLETLNTDRRSKWLKTHFKDGKDRPGSEPWVAVKYFYRSLEAIANRGLRKENAYSLSLDTAKKAKSECKKVDGEGGDGHDESQHSGDGNHSSSPASNEQVIKPNNSTQENQVEAVREALVASSSFTQDGEPVIRSSGWTALHPHAIRDEATHSTPAPHPSSPSHHSRGSSRLPTPDFMKVATALSTTTSADPPAPDSASVEEDKSNSADGSTDANNKPPNEEPPSSTPTAPRAPRHKTPPATPSEVIANARSKRNGLPSPPSVTPHKRPLTPASGGRRAKSATPATKKLRRISERSEASVLMHQLLAQEATERDGCQRLITRLQGQLKDTKAEIEKEKNNTDDHDHDHDDKADDGDNGKEQVLSVDELLERKISQHEHATERLADVRERLAESQKHIKPLREMLADLNRSMDAANEEGKKVAATDSDRKRRGAFLAALDRVQAGTREMQPELVKAAEELPGKLAALQALTQKKVELLREEVVEAELMAESVEDIQLFDQY